MLGMKRNGRERWKGVARRCGLRVFDGEGKNKREVSWSEAENILSLFESSTYVRDMDTGVKPDSFDLGLDEEHLKTRAARSGTPFSPARFEEFPSEPDSASDREYEEEASDLDDLSMPASSASIRSSRNSPESELNTLEDFDREASRNEELCLWRIIGVSPPPTSGNTPRREDKVHELELKDSDNFVVNSNNWRDWTEYRADWEYIHTPIPAASFQANQKKRSLSHSVSYRPSDTDYDTQMTQPSSADGNSDGKRKKRSRTSEREIPIRGSHAYALQEGRMLASEDRMVDVIGSNDDAKYPV